ncbi:MAG: mechanosensitive ion channel family protein [Atopobiaceae bacterium]|nr:mechanosensitive ion channel family protein [Atopobiaceae bacterium]
MSTNEVRNTLVDVLGRDVSSNAAKVVLLLAVIIAAFVASRVVAHTFYKVLDKSEMPSASIFVNLARALVWGFALLVVLQPVFGIEPTGFVAAIGVTSVALSLGLQDTISNIFGGLSLMVSKVVAPGDVVDVGGVVGEVTDVSLRSTTVKQFNGDEQIIPNSVLSKTALTKLAPFQAGEYQLPVMLKKDADLNEVRREVAELAPIALGTYYDEAFGTPLFINEFSNFGISAFISLHCKPGISPGKARTAMADAIAGKPWLE